VFVKFRYKIHPIYEEELTALLTEIEAVTEIFSQNDIEAFLNKNNSSTDNTDLKNPKHLALIFSKNLELFS